MGLSTVEEFKHLQASDAILLSDAELRQLQLVLVSIVVDIDSVCRAAGLDYMLGGGSALGARRHGGFIPWDDDVDLNMPRKDYGRFIHLFRERFSDKYWIHTPAETGSYGLALARIRLKGTSVKTREDLANRQQECGAFVDLFIIENTFDNPFLRFLHGMGSLAFGLLYSCRKFFYERKFIVRWMKENHAFSLVFKLKLVLGFFLSFLSLDFWTRLWDRWNGMCHNANSKFVTVPVGRRHFWGELVRRDEFCETGDIQWEGRTVKCSRHLDRYMQRLYGGDYLTPPPVEKREKHVVFDPFYLYSSKDSKRC